MLDLLRRHQEETGSSLAERLLETPEATLDRMTKILPRDYDAVLRARADALDEDWTPMATPHGRRFWR